jgi:hypothetical protein
MTKISMITGIAVVTVLAAVSVSAITSSPFPSPASIICGVIGAFAAITVEQA